MEGRRWALPWRRESWLPEVFQRGGEIGTGWGEKFTRRASNRRVRSKAAEGEEEHRGNEWHHKDTEGTEFRIGKFSDPRLRALCDLMVK